MRVCWFVGWFFFRFLSQVVSAKSGGPASVAPTSCSYSSTLSVKSGTSVAKLRFSLLLLLWLSRSHLSASKRINLNELDYAAHGDISQSHTHTHTRKHSSFSALLGLFSVLIIRRIFSFRQMATPIMSGNAALVRQFYREGWCVSIFHFCCPQRGL